MMRFASVLFIFFALCGSALAQFTGYPPSGTLPLGQGSSVPPQWTQLNGDCVISTALGLIRCTKTNGVTFYTGLSTPVNPSDAATKQYVDNSASGLSIHTAAVLGTVAALPANTYNNGASGVGATLTATSNGALSVDSIAVSNGQRILVRNEAAPANNGIYVVTAAGSGGAPYVLTRSTDANTAGTADVNKIGFGTFVFVSGGSGGSWTVNSTVTTIGTSAINWVQFSSAGVTSIGGLNGVIACGLGVVCNGSTISLLSVVPQGRLTLLSNTPVMTTNQAAKTTIFYDCFHGGNIVPVFNGTTDTLLAIGACEISTALESSGAGLESSANVFDVWAINVGAALTLCVATNGSGGGWASDASGSNTARGTGYTQLDVTTRSYITNKNALTHCYNGVTDRGSIAANQATYLGTFYTTAAGQTTYSFGASGAPPTAGCFCIWNVYNRVNAVAGINDSRGAWAFATSPVREADALNNLGVYRVSYVTGLAEDPNTAQYIDLAEANSTGGGTGGFVGVCFNVTNAFDGAVISSPGFAANEAGYVSGQTVKTTVGFNFFSACEQNGIPSAPATFFGSTTGRPFAWLQVQGNF